MKSSASRLFCAGYFAGIIVCATAMVIAALTTGSPPVGPLPQFVFAVLTIAAVVTPFRPTFSEAGRKCAWGLAGLASGLGLLVVSVLLASIAARRSGQPVSPAFIAWLRSVPLLGAVAGTLYARWRLAERARRNAKFEGTSVLARQWGLPLAFEAGGVLIAGLLTGTGLWQMDKASVDRDGIVNNFFLDIRQGRIQQIRDLLDKHRWLIRSTESEDGRMNPLHSALLAGQKEITSVLLEKGAELDLFAAAGLGRKDVVAEILRENPELVNAAGYNGYTPLHWAAHGFGTAEVANLLLDKGAAPYAQSTGEEPLTPLHLAAIKGNLEVAQALLARGVPVDLATTSRNLTPLHLAARAGQAEMAAFLIDKNARLSLRDAKGRTPLQLAKAANDAEGLDLPGGADTAECIRLLEQHGPR